MKKVIAIIGNGNSGKSTLITHLTGLAHTNRVTRLRCEGKDVDVYVRSQALQEKHPGISPEELIKILQEQNVDYIILALRIESVNHMPRFNIYLDYLQSNGFIISSVIYLGIESLDPNITSYRFNISPSNVLAKEVRKITGFE